MNETGLTGKRRSTTTAATPDDGKSERKRRRLVAWQMLIMHIISSIEHKQNVITMHEKGQIEYDPSYVRTTYTI